MLDLFVDGLGGIDCVGGWLGVDGALTDSGGASGMRFARLSSRMDRSTTTSRPHLAKQNFLYVTGIKQTVFCDDSRVRQHGDVSPTSEAWWY